MAVELPEPDYYTIAEVAERWGVSQDYLLRLGREGKLVFCAHSMGNEMSLFSKWLEDPDSENAVFHGFFPMRKITDKEAIEFGLYRSNSIFRGLFKVCSGSIAEIMELGQSEICDITLVAESVFDPAFPSGLTTETTLPDDWVYLFDPLVTVTISDLLIPISEIRRIENRHQEAQQAAAEDVLGAKSSNLLLTIINALCDQAGIDPRARNATSEIVRLLDLQGTPASDRAVREHIKDIPEAMRARKTTS